MKNVILEIHEKESLASGMYYLKIADRVIKIIKN
jgi:hypothetical protein